MMLTVEQLSTENYKCKLLAMEQDTELKNINEFIFLCYASYDKCKNQKSLSS
jgi:hypothetical protein